eukprot:7001609-Alexandrium_andersonii.AAC.1
MTSLPKALAACEAMGKPCATLLQLRDSFAHLSPEELAKVAEAGDTYAVEQPVGSILYTPDGFLVLESTLNNTDCVGLRVVASGEAVSEAAAKYEEMVAAAESGGAEAKLLAVIAKFKAAMAAS